MPCAGYSDALLAQAGLVASADGLRAAHRRGGAVVAMPRYMTERGYEPDMASGVPKAAGVMVCGADGGGGGSGIGDSSRNDDAHAHALVAFVGSLLVSPLAAARRQLNRCVLCDCVPSVVLSSLSLLRCPLPNAWPPLPAACTRFGD